MIAKETSDGQPPVKIKKPRVRLMTPYPEWQEHILSEALMDNPLIPQSEASYTQNLDRGIRSETLYIHSQVEQPTQTLMAETIMPAPMNGPHLEIPEPTKHKKRHAELRKKRQFPKSGHNRRFAVIYSEASAPDGSIRLTDIHSIPSHMQTSWHHLVSMNRVARVVGESDETMPRARDVSEGAVIARYASTRKKYESRGGKPNRKTGMKHRGYNFDATPEEIDRHIQELNEADAREETSETVIYEPVFD